MKSYSCRTALGEVAVRDGGGDGRPVLLVHGNSLCSASWRHQLSGDFGPRWRLLAFDLPGHGESPRPAEPQLTYRFSGYARLLREVADRLDLDAPVVVGHSLGGHIALQAIAAGLAVSGLVIFGTPPMGDPPDFAAAFRLESLGDRLFRADLSPADVLAVAALFMPDGEAPPPCYARSLSATDPAARGLLGASLARDRLSDEQAVLRSLRCPAAILHGELDRLVRLEYLRSVRAPSLWRQAVQLIPGAGHCPQHDRPEAFNRLLNDYLAGLAG